MLAGLIIALLPDSDDVHLKVMPKGAMPVMGGYMPQRLQLSDKLPDGLLRSSAIGMVEFGTLKFGPKGSKQSHLIAVGNDGTLYVDANGNGDLSDDPEVEWKGSAYKGSDGEQYSRRRGSFSVDLTMDGKVHRVSFGAYRFDPEDPAQAVYKKLILYYCDYALTGEITLGGETYTMMLADRKATGDFNDPACQVMIDRDGNGKYDSRFEVYPAGKPFNIGGTTYEIDLSRANDCVVSPSVSSASVEEKFAPPNLSVGQTALSFEAVATDGKKIKFPETYKGKIVMLDFWATWCGPCIVELPNVTKAYEEFHGQGFEILSISLDQKDKAEHLAKFTKEHNMPWRQIYDGQYWDARIAVLYGIRGIPAVLLVDGDTGEIIADASTLRGSMISDTISKALAKKRGS